MEKMSKPQNYMSLKIKKDVKQGKIALLYRPTMTKMHYNMKKLSKCANLSQIYVKITLIYGPQNDKNGPKY